MATLTTSTYTIRYALESDIPVILQLINELASYEKALHEVLATEATLKSTLSFPIAPKNGTTDPSSSSTEWTSGFAKTLLIAPADQPASIAGMALFFHNYSTWRAAPGIFLEDLFVRPTYRKRGYGKALIQALARECVRLGCKRLEWNVLKWNTPSIEFYLSEAVGATRMEDWVGMRVDNEALERLAGSSTDSA
jgi:GNAT superfamily N-acetyltransferase